MPNNMLGYVDPRNRKKHQKLFRIRLTKNLIRKKLRKKPTTVFAGFIAFILIGRKFTSSFFNLHDDMLLDVNDVGKVGLSISTAACVGFVSTKGTIDKIKNRKPQHASTHYILNKMESTLLMQDHELAKMMNLDQQETLNFIINRIRQRDGSSSFHKNEYDFFFDADYISYVRRNFIHEQLNIKNIPQVVNSICEQKRWLSYRQPSQRMINRRSGEFSDYLKKINDYIAAPSIQILFPGDDEPHPAIFSKDRCDLILLYLVASRINEIIKKLRKYLDQYCSRTQIFNKNYFFEDNECKEIIRTQTHEFVLLIQDQSDYHFFEYQLHQSLLQEIKLENEARREAFQGKQDVELHKIARKYRVKQEKEALNKLRRLSRVSYKIKNIDLVDVNSPDDDIDLETFTARQEEYEVGPFLKSNPDHAKLLRKLLLKSRKGQINNERLAYAELKPFYTRNINDNIDFLVPDEVKKNRRLKHANLNKYFKDKIEKGITGTGYILAFFNLIFYSFYTAYKAFSIFSIPVVNYIISPIILLVSLYNSYQLGFKKINQTFLAMGAAFSDLFYQLRDNIRKNKKRLLKVATVLGVVATYTASSVILFHNSIYKVFEKMGDLVIKLSKLVGGVLTVMNPHIMLPIVVFVVSLSVISSMIIYYHQVDHGLPDSVRQSARKAWNDLKDARYHDKSKFACYLIGYIIGIIFTGLSTVVEICGNHTSFIEKKFNYTGLLYSMMAAGIIGNTLYNLPDTVRGVRKSTIFIFTKIKNLIARCKQKKLQQIEVEAVGYDDEISTYKKLLASDFIAPANVKKEEIVLPIQNQNCEQSLSDPLENESVSINKGASSLFGSEYSFFESVNEEQARGYSPKSLFDSVDLAFTDVELEEQDLILNASKDHQQPLIENLVINNPG